ncbi:hypothetical protein RJT34_30209 [Clitoria ternatea]|uniref:BED-type domain-containing protein n=1 Tax=Clitoria ternatea TaxID=43366 RepID=A0AAN9ERY6_CLITE
MTDPKGKVLSRLVASENDVLQLTNNNEAASQRVESVPTSAAHAAGVDHDSQHEKPDEATDKRKRLPNASGTRKKSIVWGHFVRLSVADGKEPKAKCNYCLKTFYCDTKKHGTSNMLAYVKSCLKNPMNIGSDLSQFVLTLGTNNNQLGSTLNRFDKDACRKVVSIYVMLDEHPFSVVEVQDGLKELSKSISTIRHVLKYVRSSSHRLRKFKECVQEVGIDSSKLVCLDVSIRWNSTYLMLDFARKFEQAFERLKFHDPSYLETLGSNGVPTCIDWADSRRYDGGGVVWWIMVSWWKRKGNGEGRRKKGGSVVDCGGHGRGRKKREDGPRDRERKENCKRGRVRESF